MDNLIGWVLLSREAVASADEAIKSIEKGVRDEVGFFALHQGLADRFFPGTSVLHTRLRYALFVPWLMEHSAERSTRDLARSLRDAETKLTGKLKNSISDEKQVEGIVGVRVHPVPVSQPPSMSYWNALATWGILRLRSDGSTPNRLEVMRQLAALPPRRRLRAIDDDGNALDENRDSPFVSLPNRPSDFYDSHSDISFDLTNDERQFLRKRLISVRRHESTKLSLLARLAERSTVPKKATMWDSWVSKAADGEDKDALVIARQAAALAGIGRAAYAVLVADACEGRDYRKSDPRHHQRLEKLVATHRNDAQGLNLVALRELLPSMTIELQEVLRQTQVWLRHSRMSQLHLLYEPYAVSEKFRKDWRARLPKDGHGKLRRRDWNAKEHPEAQLIHYRWTNVHRLLRDLTAK